MLQAAHPRASTLGRAARAVFVTCLVLASAALGLPALGDPGLAPLEDRVQWISLERELVAVDSRGGGTHSAPLGVGERVLRAAVDGEIGVALTTRRLLAVTASTGGVHAEALGPGERVVTGPELGDRVALAVTTRRVLGFDGGSGNWVAASLGPHERVTAVAVANHVAALTTDRRALGLSPVRGGFFEATLGLQEAPITLGASGDLATVRTRVRLLIFRASGARWSERSLR